MLTPKRKDAQQLTELILDTARKLFTTLGVDSVSMHQIAKCAGVGQATLYRRYAQKGDLCLELMNDHFLRFKQEIEQMLDALSDQSPHERLRAVIRRLTVFAQHESALLKAIHASLVHNRCIEADKMSFFASPPYQFLHGTMTKLLSESPAASRTIAFDPDFTAHILITAIAPHTLQHLHDAYGYTSDDIADQICRTMIDPLFLPNR